ncbi:sporulation protein YunB [Microaerobacter geothermalis]|uniref:sporulation protein YunB n=1 Tax=Microaerobacter geothermalis TaxID=674972 RepID=UPI001F3E4C87|nr:sporulation protein YunB [Microaerobacter geothermalis]MCF6092393.1 sporulation protein YunB [Microaerobacter geothermalis]
MARFGKRKKGPLSGKNVLFISLVIIVVISTQGFLYVEKNLQPTLMAIAKTKVKQYATKAINDAISKKIAMGTDFKELIEFRYDGNGKIVAAIYNYKEIARLQGETTARVQGVLDDLGKEIQPIPLGQALNSNILAQLGPEVPITLVPIGYAQVNVNIKTENAGINMVLWTVYVIIEAEVSVVIPFISEPATVSTQVPISYALVVGEVPQVYYDGNGNVTGTTGTSGTTGTQNIAPPPSIVIPTN